MFSSQNSRSESLMTPTGDSHAKVLLENLTPAQFDLRKKKFQEDHAEWFAERNKNFDEYGLWCEGLVPWMVGEIDDSDVGLSAEKSARQ